jgi:hypothetical protein
MLLKYTTMLGDLFINDLNLFYIFFIDNIELSSVL